MRQPLFDSSIEVEGYSRLCGVRSSNLNQSPWIGQVFSMDGVLKKDHNGRVESAGARFPT